MKLEFVFFIILNLVFVYIIRSQLLHAKPANEHFIANTPSTIMKLCVKFPEKPIDNYKNIGGIPTHYNHLIFNIITKLIELKLAYNSLDQIVLYAPHDYTNERFLSIIETLLPFVSINTNPDAYTYYNIYLFVPQKVTAQNLRTLNTYMAEFMDTNTSYSSKRSSTADMVLIKRSSSASISDKNGFERRSILNFEELEKALGRYALRNKITFKVVVLEEMDILEQIQTFQNAKYVIGQHGAGLTNTVWCNRCKLVFELNSNNRPYFLQHNFHQFAEEWNVVNYTGDHITVDTNHLINIMQKTMSQ